MAETLDVFLSRPNWVPDHVEKHFNDFYPLLKKCGFNPRTIGKNVVPISSPFDHVIRVMESCDCTIVLGLPQMRIESGDIKGEPIDKPFSLPTEWNQIEAAISIMLRKPTLMMAHKTISQRGIFERGAANVFVHEFTTMGRKWVHELEPKLEALREAVLYKKKHEI